MAENKPEKIAYENQDEIKKKIFDELKKEYLHLFKEAYVIGSLSAGKFGRYVSEYEGYFGSDIDLVAIPYKVMPEWKYEGEFHGWHKRYNIGEIEVNGTVHPINLMIPLKGNFDDMNAFREKLNWKIEKIK